MTGNLPRISDIRQYLVKELAPLYPERDANVLANIIIRTVTGSSGLHVLINTGKSLTAAEASEVERLCRELKTGRPYQYVLGETVFYGCTIRVNPSVLIPRPETEELVDMVLKENQGYSGKIIDFGTGSGCIAIALAANLPGAEVTAADISEKALETARLNAGLNNVKINFIREDILNPVIVSRMKAGIIVSNPPYVRESEKKLMQSNVIDFEPHQALFVSDADPLLFYRGILAAAGFILEKGGKVYFEINEALGGEMTDLLKHFGYENPVVIKDLNDRDRFIKGEKR